MNKTVSMVLCGALGLGLGACIDKDLGMQPTSSNSNGDGDGDTDPGDGDGDGDAETGDADSNTTDGNLTFVPPEDIPGIKACDNFVQDCPMGEKCVPYASSGGVWDATKCVPVMGDQAAGDSCTYSGIVDAIDDCDENTHCWDVMDVDGVSMGVCTPFCEGTVDNPICGSDTSCLVANDGSINLCIATCDPLLQDCQGDGIACYWANNDFNCIFSTQDIAEGEPCGYINDCARGLICLDASVLPSCQAGACCASYCALSEGGPCSVEGTECTAFFEEGVAKPGLEDTGVCIIPGA